MTAVKPGLPCDDSDPCTKGEVCVSGGCTQGTNICKCESTLDCLDKDDGNLCNGVPYCNKQTGACEANPASIVVCPTVDNTLCSKNACAPKTGVCGLANEPTGTLCQDGDSCTIGDTCDGGVCGAGTFVCTCKSDQDCAKEDDGDLCNGTMFCDVTGGVPKCKLNPSTIVTCPTVDDTQCLKRSCEPKTGKCLLKPEASGKPCDDKDACTKSDYCVDSTCRGGVFTCECAADSDCAKLDDGDLCNGVPYCDKSGEKPACKPNPASKKYCPKTSTDACLIDVCVPQTGTCALAAGNIGKSCDDGSKCTAKDTCKDGVCVGQGIDCDDASACTFDSCDPKEGCTYQATNCNDGNTCTEDKCEAKTGKCAFPPLPDGKGCDGDGTACTVGDTCKAGKCEIGPPVSCQLKTGACDRAQCVSVGKDNFKCVLANKDDGAACDDGDACTVSGVCKGGSCSPGKAHRLFERAYAPPKSTAGGHFNSVAAFDGGGALAVGGWRSGADKAARYGWWLHRTDVTGTETLSLALASTATTPTRRPTASRRCPAAGT